jgi:hypothetical protein
LQVVLYQNGARVRTLECRDEQELDETQPTWRDATATEPLYYIIRQNATTGLATITFAPTVSATITNGAKLYFLQKYDDLVDDDDPALALANFPQVQSTLIPNGVLARILPIGSSDASDSRSRTFAMLRDADLAQARAISKRLGYHPHSSMLARK